ncbi:HAD family hydrolase [Guyparkeria hydrothermalis]|uniref:HAD family hydrolase n=1 Tax=Guyparkeria TaxID=2035712 RepID=UPI0010ABC581|nr:MULTISPECIES: HAD family hydrolase [Guyparkeria]MCL7750070.1 HAD family hydrolase [Guyparkeria hydrothermalis]TKA88811.1 ATPase P [Guyparkeria sp. SB14A]
MLEITIPSRGVLHLSHLVLDYNGTLALDGALVEGVGERLHELSKHLDVHVITADTYGDVEGRLADLPVTLSTLSDHLQDEAKQRYVRTLSARECVTIGNGRNDALMLAEAVLGVGVMQPEGLSRHALDACDVICPDINSALDLLLKPKRLIATLRN